MTMTIEDAELGMQRLVILKELLKQSPLSRSEGLDISLRRSISSGDHCIRIRWHDWQGAEIDLQVSEDGKTCWLLSIEIREAIRGRGIGAQLYELLTEAASQMGCDQIVQTPSGRTTTGEARRAYLFRRGWLPDGAEVYKKLH